MTNLQPIYDSRASFYGKARVDEYDNGNKLLTSYSTVVAGIKNGKAEVYGTYSATTLRHIKEFLKQYGFKAETAKQILEDYAPSAKQENNKEEEDGLSNLKTISGIMALGDLFTDNQKDANDWKTRMLKAGLDGRGLIMPEDWDELDEAEKEARLNGAIKALS